jgi:uncharacterized protein YkwD
MYKRTISVRFVTGFIIGALVFGSTAAFATEILAKPKTAVIVIDGEVADLKGYIIEDTHYFQLRDLAAALKGSGKDFSIVWDGAENRVIIDTTRSYDPYEKHEALVPAYEYPQSDVNSPELVMTIGEMKTEIIKLVNAERIRIGVPELEALDELMQTAQDKANDMYENGYYGHNSPVYGQPGEMIKSRIPGVKSGAENLAPWSKTPVEAFESLLSSQRHRETMLNRKYTHIGVGIVEGADSGYWWVQHFIEL